MGRWSYDDAPDPLVITPTPSIPELRRSGSASVDLRLGTWFASLKQARTPYLALASGTASANVIKTHYVPFGTDFILHPQTFVLAVTLEWKRLPCNLAAYVVGKSSWGRCGLIIATATGVHPGFRGCLTLELSNVGEIPIAIKPGIRICQLFLHTVESAPDPSANQSAFGGSRRPMFRPIALDSFALKLSKANQSPT